MLYYNIDRNMLQKYKDVNVCILYDYMITNYRYIQDEIWIDDKRFVHFPIKDITADLYLSPKLIRNCVLLLECDLLVETKLLGLPAKKYYYLPYCKND